MLNTLRRRNFCASHSLQNKSCSDFVENVLQKFRSPIPIAVAYGSAVKLQAGRDLADQSAMVDLIFAVEAAEPWHAVNIVQHWSHYSALKYGGSHLVAWVQELGAGVYYNTLVPMDNRFIKYGVITIARLIHELRHWDDFYLSGRLQKPVHIARSTPALVDAIEINRINAAHTALLLLPPSFSDVDLFNTIAGLSYTGDFRMVYGENPHKVSNIVKGQLNEFAEIYLPLLHSLADGVVVSGNSIHQNDSPSVLRHRLAVLPTNLQNAIRFAYMKIEGYTAVDPLEILVTHPNRARFLSQALYSITQRSSTTQSIKGIFTGGILNSMTYIQQKLAKRSK